MKKIDEQTGGQRAKESSKKQSYEEKQIQVIGIEFVCQDSSDVQIFLQMKCLDTEREGRATERAFEERESSKTGREGATTERRKKSQRLSDILVVVKLKQQWQRVIERVE